MTWLILTVLTYWAFGATPAVIVGLGLMFCAALADCRRNQRERDLLHELRRIREMLEARR